MGIRRIVSAQIIVLGLTVFAPGHAIADDAIAVLPAVLPAGRTTATTVRLGGPLQSPYSLDVEGGVVVGSFPLEDGRSLRAFIRSGGAGPAKLVLRHGGTVESARVNFQKPPRLTEPSQRVSLTPSGVEVRTIVPRNPDGRAIHLQVSIDRYGAGGLAPLASSERTIDVGDEADSFTDEFPLGVEGTFLVSAETDVPLFETDPGKGTIGTGTFTLFEIRRTAGLTVLIQNPMPQIGQAMVFRILPDADVLGSIQEPFFFATFPDQSVFARPIGRYPGTLNFITPQFVEVGPVRFTFELFDAGTAERRIRLEDELDRLISRRALIDALRGNRRPDRPIGDVRTLSRG